MLTHPTRDKLQALRLAGMYHALVEQMQTPNIATLSFEERLGLLVDRESTERENRRLSTRLRQAKLRQAACIEDLDYRHPRGLDKALIARLATCQWVREHHHVLIAGPTGIGKTWLGCALGHKACREGFTTLYLRLPRFLQELPHRLQRMHSVQKRESNIGNQLVKPLRSLRIVLWPPDIPLANEQPDS